MLGVIALNHAKMGEVQLDFGVEKSTWFCRVKVFLTVLTRDQSARSQSIAGNPTAWSVCVCAVSASC